MSVLLGDDALLERLNRQHLEEDHPTDVLSFPGHSVNPETGKIYIGDVAISLERAELQANNAEHSLDDELQLLVVHGVLHLLGHDHAEPEEKERMWAIQDEILLRLSLSLNMNSLKGT